MAKQQAQLLSVPHVADNIKRCHLRWVEVVNLKPSEEEAIIPQVSARA